jgi:hypothetical protein
VIALIASARPGRGDGRPTFYTVPWCPRLESHSQPQLPGHVIKYLQQMGAVCRERGHDPSDLAKVSPDHMLAAIGSSKDTLGLIIFSAARWLVLELEMYPKPERAS